MNKYLKYLLLTLGIALVSGLVSWGVVRATIRHAATSDPASYTALMHSDAPASENDYGFLQSDYELTSSRTCLLYTSLWQQGIGQETSEAIWLGVARSIVHEIDAYVSEYRKRYPALELHLTGGYAEDFVK